MLGGLMGSQSTSADFGEQMLNSVARQAIQRLFTRSQTVEVTIRCSPSSKLLQGIVDSFQMRGQGLVIRGSFEAEEMEFETDAVSIDMGMGGLLKGKLKLKQATHAVASVKLTEEAINRAFEADLVRQRLENVELEELTQLSGGEPLTFRDIHIGLQPEQRVKVQAKTDLPNRDNVPISLSAQLSVERRRRVIFANPQFEAADIPEELQPLSESLLPGFIGVLNQMVDLERFDLDGVMLRVNRLEVQGKRLLFNGYAEIDHFPGGQ